MVNKIVQIRMERGDLEFIDFLVKAGICKTRSDAIQYLVSLGISSSKKLPQIIRVVEELKKKNKKGEYSIELPGATGILMSGRDRFQ